MRVVHLSVTDGSGGAGRAALRLHLALRDQEVHSFMAVRHKAGARSDVFGPPTPFHTVLERIRAKVDSLPVKLYKEREDGLFSPGLVPGAVPKVVRELRPDILHVHWIAEGFVNVSALPRVGVPIVWTLHDMWPFTGGCHHSGSCTAYEDACGFCPALGSARTRDLAYLGQIHKHNALNAIPLAVVAPSRWLVDLAGRSAILGGAPAQRIPNAVPTDTFTPRNRAAARAALGIPDARRWVLFVGAASGDNPRKGFAELMASLTRLAKRREDIGLLTVGGSGKTLSEHPTIPTIRLGRVQDETVLAQAYAAADVVACPSLEENAPNVVAEALSCGRPCVAFDVGGIPEMIVHGETGVIVPKGDIEAFAAGIDACLDSERAGKLGAEARRRALRDYAMPSVAERHLRLYDALLSSS